MAETVFVNGRFALRPVTGVERFAHEALAGLDVDTEIITPPRQFAGRVAGHLWEQTVLPLASRSHPLISLCNFGPVAHPRQLVMFHDASVFDHPEWFSPTYRVQVRQLWPMLARRAALLVTVSAWSAERLSVALGIPVSRFSILPPGGDSLSRLSPGGEPLVEDPTPTIVAVGTLEPRKNLHNLLKGWQSAQRRLPSGSRLIVVGAANTAVFNGGSPLQPTEGVIFAGRVSDVKLRQLLLSSRGLAFVPSYEGYGLPPYEAAALGVPVLVSAIPPLADSFRGHAHLADPHDVGSIADGLVRLAADPIPPPAPASTWIETSRLLTKLIREHL